MSKCTALEDKRGGSREEAQRILQKRPGHKTTGKNTICLTDLIICALKFVLISLVNYVFNFCFPNNSSQALNFYIIVRPASMTPFLCFLF